MISSQIGHIFALRRVLLPSQLPLYQAKNRWILQQVEKISIASQATPFCTEFFHAWHKSCTAPRRILSTKITACLRCEYRRAFYNCLLLEGLVPSVKVTESKWTHFTSFYRVASKQHLRCYYNAACLQDQNAAVAWEGRSYHPVFLIDMIMNHFEGSSDSIFPGRFWAVWVNQHEPMKIWKMRLDTKIP